jgi:hypothetical protein
MEDLEKEIFGVDPDNPNASNSQNIIYCFQLLLNISIDMIFQYFHLASLAELVDEDGALKEDIDIDQQSFNQDINKYSVEDLEHILKPRMKKICVLPFIHETIDSDTDYYCKTIFRDNCEDKYKNKFENGIKFHFILNSAFNEKSVKNLDDIYTVFKLHNNTYKLKFSNITKPEKHTFLHI